MTEHEDNLSEQKVAEPESGQTAQEKVERFPELVELEDKIQRRLRSNQRFLERFMDEDFDDLDDDEDVDIEEDEPDLTEEL